jgi:hypothetical protein
MCTCGQQKLGGRLDKQKQAAPRVIPYQGDSLLYARKVLDVVRGTYQLYCTSCGFVRRTMPLGGGTVVASTYNQAAREVRVAMSDVVRTACMTARLFGEGRSYSLVISAEDVTSANAVDDSSVAPPREPLAGGPSGGDVVASKVYRVAIPEGVEPGVYVLLFVDTCLRLAQPVALLPVDIIAVQTLYARSDAVLQQAGDYAAIMIGADDGTLRDQLDMLRTALLARAQIGGDLGGTASAPIAIAMQGRSVHDTTPRDGAKLRWSSGANQWTADSVWREVYHVDFTALPAQSIMASGHYTIDGKNWYAKGEKSPAHASTATVPGTGLQFVVSGALGYLPSINLPGGGFNTQLLYMPFAQLEQFVFGSPVAVVFRLGGSGLSHVTCGITLGINGSQADGSPYLAADRGNQAWFGYIHGGLAAFSGTSFVSVGEIAPVPANPDNPEDLVFSLVRSFPQRVDGYVGAYAGELPRVPDELPGAHSTLLPPQEVTAENVGLMVLLNSQNAFAGAIRELAILQP